MSRRFNALLVAVLPLLSATAAEPARPFRAREVFDPGQAVIFQNDFRSGQFGQWNFSEDDRYGLQKETPGRIDIVEAPGLGSGRNAARFTVPRAPNSFRAEISLPHENGFQERWYGERVLVPEGWVFDPNRGEDIVMQWHAIPGNWRATYPNLAISIRDTNWCIRQSFGCAQTNPVRTTLKLDDPVQRGAWSAWVVHAKWSSGNDGLLQVWKDGKLVFDRAGTNVYSTIGVEYTPYLKTGIYRPAWHMDKEGKLAAFDKENPIVAAKVVYATDIKIGDERARYEDVAPTSGGVLPAPGVERLFEEALPFLDPNRPVEERVADLISRLTLEEKATLLNHKGTTVDRFNIRSDQWNQCLNGVKWDRPTTLFPICLALAATWNTDLVHEVATVLSDEARAIYNGWHLDTKAPGEHKGLIYRAPVINIGRNPYWGRNHEAWGEDPFLCGRMAVAYVRGLQGDDPKYLKLASTLKHFAVNNVETDRTKLNAVVSERMLREYWLPHFRDAIVEGRAQSVMASYNAINGTPNNINRWLLTDVLKDEWKHEGFVVSDLGGVRTMVEGHGNGKLTFEDAVAQSVMAGCDFSDKEYEANIPSAVRSGKLSEARLNDALARVLRVRFRLGEFDPFDRVPYSRIPISVIGSPAHRAVALKAAQQSIVLLKNEGGLLPLDRSKVKRIAVIGPLADRVVLNNYNGKTGDTVSALRGIKDRAGPGVAVSFSRGCGGVGVPASAGWSDAKAEIEAAAEAARNADVAVVCVGTDASVEQEGHDRTSLGLPGAQEELVKAVHAANPRTVVIEMSAGPLAVPWIEAHAPSLLQAWWAGEEGGHAVADVLFGDANPAGRLPHTVYASDEQVPPRDEYDISKGFTYMYVKGEPLFPFGHGLSYATFRYGDLHLSSATMPSDGSVVASLEIENTGARGGDEVVQLYARAVPPGAMRPAKELRGFARVSLRPGEQKTVVFSVPGAKLARWDETAHSFITARGEHELMVGASSADIRARARVEVKASRE
jgi:beta-glucosidase